MSSRASPRGHAPRVSTFLRLAAANASAGRKIFLLLVAALSMISVGSIGAAWGAGAADAGRSVGCGKQPPSTGLLNLTTTDGNQRSRAFRVRVPAHYDPGKAYALVLLFHGAGTSSAQSYSWELQNAPGAADGALFVYPEGIKFRSDGIGWDDSSTGYDLPFFDHMVGEMETQFCVDAARIFAAGFSWGGDFVTTLICERGQVLRAAVVNSASDEFKDRADYSTYQNMPCPGTKRPAIRFEHADGGDSQYPAPFFATTSALLQHLSACGSRAPASRTGALSCASFTACANDYTECSFDARIGHALPPGWAADTWAFFSTVR